MKDKLNDYWKSRKKLSRSMKEMLSNNILTELYGDEKDKGLSIIERINKKLYQYKEIKMFCKKTHIPGFYYLCVLFICLLIILFGYCQNVLTILIATIYPLYMSFKTLQFRLGEEKEDGGIYDENDERKDRIQWLSYWVIFSIFINFESIFSSVLKKIPLYFFAKIVFLLLCFLPNYELSSWLYNKFVRKLFVKYEDKVVGVAASFIAKLKAKAEESDRKKKIKTKGDSYFSKKY